MSTDTQQTTADRLAGYQMIEDGVVEEGDLLVEFDGEIWPATGSWLGYRIMGRVLFCYDGGIPVYGVRCYRKMPVPKQDRPCLT